MSTSFDEVRIVRSKRRVFFEEQQQIVLEFHQRPPQSTTDGKVTQENTPPTVTQVIADPLESGD